MLSQRLYYAVKPCIPLQLRRGVRSILAHRRRALSTAVWPIDQSAGKLPLNWPGWPDGKKFAVVLTHDVESSVGLAKHAQLADLEFAHGFRSSFNFVPEGDYAVTREQRDHLSARGFEVGIHDLHHDGKLFNSKRKFQEHAHRINHYAKDWGASGFRAGFMLRNLDWFHQLDIKYDASTFDTDPFEHQPDGVRTIFPLWMPGPGKSEKGASPAPSLSSQSPGYVELPYTLPQDSTLFLILGETTPEIWLRKTDWIVRHGGMLLVNVHPDYMRFPGEEPSRRTYPADHYAQLLNYLRKNFGDSFWQPLPRDMADFVAKLPAPPMLRKPKRICMVSHSFYLGDNRVRRYAETLAARGDQVDVFALGLSDDQEKEEVINGVRMLRIQNRSVLRKEQSALAYLLPLVRFLVVASWHVTRSHLKQRYDCIHIHNIPDFLVFSAWYPRFTGTPIILDIHDIVPELFASKFRREPSGFLFSFACLMERASAGFADHIIIANDLWYEKYAARTHSKERCTPFINNVDTDIFYPRPRLRRDGRLIMIFPGGLQWHQGVDIAIRAFRTVSDALPTAEFHIYGGGNAKESLIALVQELKLESKVLFFNGVNLDRIAGITAEADLGIVPKRADSFGNEAYSTKIMEFMSVGVPAVISETKVDRYYFNDDVVRFFESGNHEALAAAVIEVLGNTALRQQMVTNALAYVSKNNWNTRKGEYLNLVDTLCN